MPVSAPRLALVLLLLLLAACTEPVPVDHGDYIGHWRGDGVLLVIQADGHADYERVRSSGRTSIEGPAHSFTTQGFKIGVGPLSAPFKVSRPPHLHEGRWRMTVDGVDLTRVMILPMPPPVEVEREGAGESLRL